MNGSEGENWWGSCFFCGSLGRTMRSGRSPLGGLLYGLCRWFVLYYTFNFSVVPVSLCTIASMGAFQKKQLDEKLREEAEHQDLTDLGALSFEIFIERASNSN